MATLAQVRASILFAIDEASANWATPTEVNNMVESAYRAAWDLLIDKYEDYVVTKSDFVIASGASSFTFIVDSAPATGQVLRTDFYKLRMLQRLGTVDGKYRAIDRFELEESGNFDQGIGYMFLGDVIYVETSDQAPGSYRAWYIPQPTSLAGNDNAVLLDPVNDGVRQYVIDVVCMRLKAKDDVSPAVFKGFADALEARISKMAGHRNARPRRIPDVRDSLPARFNTRRRFFG